MNIKYIFWSDIFNSNTHRPFDEESVFNMLEDRTEIKLRKNVRKRIEKEIDKDPFMYNDIEIRDGFGDYIRINIFKETLIKEIEEEYLTKFNIKTHSPKQTIFDLPVKS